MKYLSENFLLHCKAAQRLFHDYAETAPIFDYHNHLSPRLIAEDARFENITQVWLGGDHYKWRAMRSNGVDENSITGTASDEEKFSQWAKTLPKAVRNPLYDWTHLELKRYFGVDKLLSEKTAPAIYAHCNERLKEKSFSIRNLLKKMNVAFLCTTDDPVDDLSWHQQLKREKFAITVRPTFRPDKAMAIEDPVAYNHYINALEKVSGIAINSYATLLEALDKRHAFFHENGCRSSDHAFETLTTDGAVPNEISTIFSFARSGRPLNAGQILKFKTAMLLELCRMNHRRGWAQQLHFGVIRNARTRIFKSLGPDTGVDCIGDNPLGRPLCAFLDALDTTDQLTKTIFFNIYPADNEMLVSIAGAFQDGTTAGKMQLGPAWWFLDQKDCMARHLEALSGLGLLSRFVGMTTDSRSFLSFPRHEYFRRILCGALGRDMENGDIPRDFDLIGGIVRDICFANAKNYFSLDADAS
ncbi:MAG: glucuronate isomerase [Chitinivibrionales bacterium]